MRKTSQRNSAKSEPKDPRARPLSHFIAIAFLVAVCTGVAAFIFYWFSDGRQLAVDVQRAMEDEIANPFLNPDEAQSLNVDNGLLEPEELDLLMRQITDFKYILQPQTDFALPNEAHLEAILEF